MRLSSFLVCLLAFITTVSAQGLSPEARFAGVKRWKFIYSYHASSPFTWEEGGYTHNRHTWVDSESGTIELTTEYVEGGKMKLAGGGTVSASTHFGKTITGPGGYYETRYDRGSGAPVTNVSILLEFDLGTYDLDINSGEFGAKYGGTKRWSTDNTKYGPEDEITHVNPPWPAPAEKKLTFPESGRVLSGSWSWQERWKKEPEFRDGFNLAERAQVDHTSGSVRWMLIPDDALDVELIVEPQGYADWIPQGGKDEKTAGNTIAIKATLVDKKTGGAPSAKARRMRFAMTESSCEKGVALNWPIDGASDTYDLGFESDKNSGWKIEGDGITAISSDGSYETTTATLSSFDFGAFGAVMATAELEDGRVVVGHLKGESSRAVMLPKRAAGSGIADKWKELNGFGGADTEDDDVQRGNDHNGDGLTAYEEYRGLVVDGKHSRTSAMLSPKLKELVVRNDIGGEAKAGFSLFSSASGINIVEVKEAELPKSRRVNQNGSFASGGPQFGLWLKTGEVSDGTAGENRPAATLNKTPRLSEEVIINLKNAAEFYEGQSSAAKAGGVTVPYTLADDIANTIAHEIAHGVSAPHHGKDTDFRGPKTVTDRMTDWGVFGMDGKPLSRPIELKGKIGRPGNSASGDAGCIMCYTNYYQWAAVGPAGGPYKYYAIPLQPLGSRFCTSASATGMNAPRKVGDMDVPGFFGDAIGQGSDSPVGNCLGAMHVKDW